MADISVGGEGAPLVPYMDRALLRRHYERSGSVGMMLNVGGICNVSIWLPGRREMVGFDCGPGGGEGRVTCVRVHDLCLSVLCK